MTVGQDNAIATPAPGAEPKPNPFQRIIGVLFSPDATFASIARRPDWVVPLVLLLLVSLAAGIIMGPHIDFGAAARESMEQNKNVPQEQVDKAVRISASIGKVITYLSPVLSLIGLLVIAGVVLLAFRIFGGEGDFRQAFSVTCYASIPTIIKSVVTLIIIIAKGGIIPAQALATIVRSNLGFLVDYKTNPVAFALLSSFDIFSVWFLALLIIGFSYVARVSKVKAAVTIISLWILVLLLKLIGPALQSLRASK
ncbi:MAG: YIP1 family protein [Acidobacteria bacterium]|nr:YIP1 family protein [Acidobacteriota bacterium]MBV9067755.1 YIP1 family protein [Acidobacteriota bacterium]MBV9188605.1 YIP1 family protein [Acidobacteriota bacterium]